MYNVCFCGALKRENVDNYLTPRYIYGEFLYVSGRRIILCILYTLHIIRE